MTDYCPTPAENAAELHRLRLLDTAPENAFDHVVAIAAQVFSAPTVLVSLLDFDRQWFKARVGMEPCETSLEVSFCKHAVRGENVFVVPDATRHPLFVDNALVTQPGGIRFYAGAPLRTKQGYAIGTLCIIDQVPRDEFSIADQALLSQMADLVVELIEGRASRVAADELSAKLSDFTSTALDLFWETDENHRFTHLALPGDGHPDADRIQRVIPSMLGRTRWEIAGSDPEQEPWRSHFAMLKSQESFRDFRYSYPIEGQQVHFSASGKPIYDDRGRFLGYRGASRDVTKQEEMHREAIRASNTDPLTGLNNRRSWSNLLVEGAADKAACSSVLLLDIDRFKDVNDALGHAIGDAILIEFAKRLKNCIPKDAEVARLGGDEFAIYLPADACAAMTLAHRVLAEMNTPLHHRGHHLCFSASIGVASSIPDAPAEAMTNADLALRRAKVDGRNRAVRFTPEMRDANANRVAVAVQLPDAIANSEFELVYQPQIGLGDGKVTGVEALLRWRHPKHGLLSPSAFLDALEGSVHEITVGRLVIDEACRQAAAWYREGLPVRMGVNVSSGQLYGDDIASLIDEAIDRYDVPAGLIEVEITERVALRDNKMIGRTLSKVADLGCSIAFDDFGTGFASLSSLTCLPLDHVKIDKQFIQGVEQDDKKQKIVGGLIGLCDRLGYGVIAEGVETASQEAFLCDQACPEVQGYFYSKPLSTEKATAFICSRNRSVVSTHKADLRFA